MYLICKILHIILSSVTLSPFFLCAFDPLSFKDCQILWAVGEERKEGRRHLIQNLWTTYYLKLLLLLQASSFTWGTKYSSSLLFLSAFSKLPTMSLFPTTCSFAPRQPCTYLPVYLQIAERKRLRRTVLTQAVCSSFSKSSQTPTERV